ncbi:MAG: DivIVA domain-containing protein [bacterium]|nr:DivIVA domain-containing protein [bacterium]
MELSPAALRDIRFTERFRGYDAAEVDAFLSEAADALEELIAERSEPLAALAAERARLAIDQVREDTLEEIEGLQSRRDELAQAIADLRLMLAERRRGLVEALALIDAAGEQAADSGDGARAEEVPEAGADSEEVPEAGSDSDAAGEPAGDESAGTDSFLARLERAAAESGESAG